MKTKTSNQKRANEMLKKGLKQVIEAGIVPGNVNPEITINTRAARRFGLCSQKRNGSQMQYDFVIELNHMLLTVDEKYAMETVVHEILHTVEGCMNHGPKWKKAAAIMNEKYGYNVKTSSSYSERGLEAPKGKYEVRCASCKNSYYKNRMCNLIKYPKRFICSCGVKGTLEVVNGNSNNTKQTSTTAANKVATPTAKKTSTPTVNKPASLGYKYTVQCDSCGSQTGRKVASAAIKNIEKYRCRCGNKSLKVIQNY